MKKHVRKNLKLHLYRETLQALEKPDSLQGIVGGISLAMCPTSARTCPVSNCCDSFKIC
jgi:hypothetical protein